MPRTTSIRIPAALMVASAPLLLVSPSVLAAECVGPDSPADCTPVASPAPSVIPDPAPAAEPDPADSPASSVVVLDADQMDALVWIGGAVLAVSIASLVGSWSR
ncbi:MAG: hypothetical protein WCF36_18970 [Candidatus Nanopelagicales bacterium]